ncbi:MAG TPA: glycosyltransferase [Acidimicrobiales bacterium]|nr:glycosyltransferase [Acidimicrobiales bacterium]
MTPSELHSATYDGGPVPKVSVIVATYNRGALLAELLAALEQQTMAPSDYEVVVVDDASDDDTWDRLDALNSTTALRLAAVRLEANGGQGPARNVGVAMGRAPLVAFTDDDCLPTPGWLHELTTPFAGADSAVVVQGRVEPWPDDRDDGGVWARTVWVLRPTWLFETCNIAYRRQAVLDAGGFPGRDRAPATARGKLVGEDALLGWRVVEAGAELTFAPEALVHHRHEPATYWQWVAALRGRGVFPALVRRSRFGRRALWMGTFLAPRTAAFDAAVAGVVVGAVTVVPWWLLAVVPWVVLAWPEARWRKGRPAVVRLVQMAVGDLVGQEALVVAALRSRCLVL